METNGNVLDKLHYNGEVAYTKRHGNVRYLDGSELKRPQKMPWIQRLIALVFVAIALGISWYIVDSTLLAQMRDVEQSQKTVEDNLKRESAIVTVPYVPDLVNLDDETILAMFADMGYTIYDTTSTSGLSSLSFYKIPADVTLDDAMAMFARGTNNLTAPQASKLLQGLWFCNVDRTGATTVVVRYSDFTTDDPQIAIQNAFLKEGFTTESITGEGVDETGNTYRMGTVDVDGEICTWRISAIDLEDVYSVQGVTEEGVYVGIRVTKSA